MTEPYDVRPEYPSYAPAYRPLPTAPSDLATAALVLAGVVTVLQAVSAAASWWAAGSYREAARDGVPPVEVLTAYDAVGFLLLAAMLAAYVVTSTWLYRSRTLTDQLAPQVKQERRPVWAWLGWWVPIVSFWFPYQVVRGVQVDRPGRRPVDLGGWWACWVVFIVLNRVSARISGSAEVRSDGAYTIFALVETVVAAVLVVALVRWVTIVKDITAGQQHLLRAAQ
ncbi:DUF4328 domain-containing protein [Nocardioides dongkuii]|uniref:DUF4328 domain-containing protein n=1 Tax=Nocardioides dongkuii TaxID=2760089 RepID=UPI0015F8377C|nr:DUF4328 domain-containing protein [Nocardioides dongkuii]